MLAETRDRIDQANAHGAAAGRFLPIFTLFLLGLVIRASTARADILDRSGNVIPGTEGIIAQPGVDLFGFDLTNASLSFANLYGAEFGLATLTNADFTGANLIAADFSAATFNNATFTAPTIFTNAQIASTDFNFGTSQGFTQAMLAGDPITHVGATASYLVKDLIGVNLSFNDLSGWDFSGQNMASGGLAVGSFNTFDTGAGTFHLSDFTQANLAGVSAAQSAFGNSTLTVASFYQANLASVDFSASDLSNATLTYANLNYATLSGATLTGVDMTNATVASANFSATTAGTVGFTQAQFYSTKSYADKDIRGINLSSNTLTGWDFSNQNAASADFSNATLSGNGTLGVATFNGANLTHANFSGAALSTNGTGNFTDFSGASVNFANFSNTTAHGFTKDQLYSTASYQNMDLTGIDLSFNNLTTSGSVNGGWDFSNRDVSSANFSNSTLSAVIGLTTYAASFTNATVNFTNFSSTTSHGFTPAMLVSTASAVNGDLHGINLSSNILTGANGWTMSFSAQDLTGATFDSSNLSTTSFSGSTLTLASFNNATLTGVDFSSASVMSANFSNTVVHGFTATMLGQTSGYLSQDLRGINLSSNDFSRVGSISLWNFAGQNLTGASFSSSNLSTTSFAGATLTFASLDSATLNGTDFTSATLQFANLSNAQLLNVNFGSADLTGANFSFATFSSGTSSLDGATFNHATIRGANLSQATLRGFSPLMLYATDSYQIAQDLSGIDFSGNDMTGWAFGDATHKPDLSFANFSFGTLANAQFGGTTIAFANFSVTTDLGFTEGQLMETASYVNHDLHGVNLSFNDLRNWDFTGQDLSTTNFSNSLLSSGGTTDFTAFDGAIILGANFSNTTASGFTKEQLYATQSYIDGNLSHVDLSFNSLAPVNPVSLAPLAAWDLHNQRLDGANFDSSVLSNFDPSTGSIANSVDFTGSSIKDASFNSTTDKGFTSAQLYSTQSYVDHNLGAIGLGSDNLSGWDLSGQAMHGADFAYSVLDSTNFTGARIGGADFTHTTPFGFTSSQLYSTLTYASLALGNINLSQNNLAGWNFASQSMAHSNFSQSLLTGANFNDSLLQNANFFQAGLILTSFDRADLRGAIGFTGATLSTANTILPDGTIQGLDLTADTVTLPSDRHLVIRDYNGAPPVPIHITKGVNLDSTSTLAIRLHDGSWGSTISFDPGIPITLAGTLDLGVEDDAIVTDLYNYSGHLRPIPLFNWNSTPSSQFDIVATDQRFSWDISDLYMGGTVLINGLYGDINRDGRVDVSDLLVLAQNWQQSAPDWTDGDMNGDGIVNIADLRLLADNWGFGIPSASMPVLPALAPLLTSLDLPIPASVPEPVTALPLMLLTAITCLRRKRRRIG